MPASTDFWATRKIELSPQYSAKRTSMYRPTTFSMLKVCSPL